MLRQLLVVCFVWILSLVLSGQNHGQSPNASPEASQKEEAAKAAAAKSARSRLLSSKTGPIIISAPCDPQHPKYLSVKAKATVKCVMAHGEDPVNYPPRALVYCFPACGGPWTLKPDDSETVLKDGTLAVVGNGKGSPATCGATVAVTDAALPGPVHPPPSPYIPGKIEGRTVKVKVGHDVSSEILGVAYMCHLHSFIPNNTLVYFDGAQSWEYGWMGAPQANGLTYYGSHTYSIPGTYKVYLRADVYCPNGENNGYDAAKGEATVNVTQ